MSLFSSLFRWFKKEPTSDTCEDRERRYPSEQSADMCSQENDTVEVERGDIVLGVIRKIIRGGLLVDIGLEDMAFLPKEETGSHPYTWNRLLGKEHTFVVLKSEYGSVVVSLRIALEIDRQKRSEEERENPAENRFKLRVLDVHQNHCAFTESFGQYVAGVLYGHNIKADGHSLPIYMTDLLLDIYSTLDTPVTFEVIGSFASDGLEYAILQKDHKTFYSDVAKGYFHNLKVGDSMALKLLGATANYKILRDPKHAFWAIVS